MEQSRLRTRRHRQRGATIVEYALGLALFVLVAGAGLENLQGSTSQHYTDSTDEFEDLPGSGGWSDPTATSVPGPSTTLPATSTTTTVVDSSPPDGSTTTTTIAPQAVARSITDISTTQGSRKWRAIAEVLVDDSMTGEPVSGARVTVQFDAANGARSTASCTTGQQGKCSVTWGNRESIHSPVLATTTNITASPAWDQIPATGHLHRP